MTSAGADPATDSPRPGRPTARSVPHRVSPRLLSALPVLVAALPLLALSVHAALHARDGATPFGDTAVLMLRTLAASRGHELLGPYSRFGWQHPGPAFFYWAAPFLRLSGLRVGGMALAAALCNLGWVLVAVTAAKRAGGRAAAWVLAVVVTVATWRIGIAWFQNPWNPLLVILPIVAAAVLAAAVAHGLRWALPLLAVTVSFTVQTHVGTAGVLAAMLAVTLPFAAWQQRRSWRRWTRSVVVTVVATVVVWLPPIGEELAHSPGNLSETIRFFREHRSPGHPLGDVLRLVTPQFTLGADRLGTRITGPTTLLHPVSSIGTLVLALMAVALVAGVVHGVRTRRPYVWALNAATLAGALAAIASTRTAFGELEAYFTSFSTGLGILAWTAFGTTAASVLAHRTSAPDTARTPGASAPDAPSPSVAPRPHPPRPLHTRPVLAAASLAFLLSVGVASSGLRVTPLAEAANRRSVGVLAQWADTALAGHPHDHVLVRFVGPDPWVDGAGLMVELERRGIRVSVRPELYYLFGPTYRSRGNEQMTLVVTHSSFEDPRIPAVEGGRYLGTNVDGMALWVLPGRVFGPAQGADDGSSG